MKHTNPSRSPRRWKETKIRRVLAHYEKQTPDEATTEDEASYRSRRFSLVSVPVKLLPAVRKMIAKNAG